MASTAMSAAVPLLGRITKKSVSSAAVYFSRKKSTPGTARTALQTGSAWSADPSMASHANKSTPTKACNAGLALCTFRRFTPCRRIPHGTGYRIHTGSSRPMGRPARHRLPLHAIQRPPAGTPGRYLLLLPLHAPRRDAFLLAPLVPTLPGKGIRSWFPSSATLTDFAGIANALPRVTSCRPENVAAYVKE
jgi:hypothetical protein